MIAFISLWVQSAGLFGPEGIVPYSENHDQARMNIVNGSMAASRLQELQVWRHYLLLVVYQHCC